MKFLDLSHTIEEKMTLFRSFPKPKIERFFDCEQSMAFYRGVTLEVTGVNMVTSLGTWGHISTPLFTVGLKDRILPRYA